LRVPGKAAHVGFIREIDRDLRLMGNRMQCRKNLARHMGGH
jgi:hypothetical protein